MKILLCNNVASPKMKNATVSAAFTLLMYSFEILLRYVDIPFFKYKVDTSRYDVYMELYAGYESNKSRGGTGEVMINTTEVGSTCGVVLWGNSRRFWLERLHIITKDTYNY